MKRAVSQKCEFTKNFLGILNKNIKIQGKIETKSNLKYEVLETLLDIFDINVDIFKKYKPKLNKSFPIRRTIEVRQTDLHPSLDDRVAF